MDYIGCLTHGSVLREPGTRWFEPESSLLGSEYFLHAWGPLYVLLNRAVRMIRAISSLRPPVPLRVFANEDVTVGSWMLALNVRHESDLRLCRTTCTDDFLAVYDLPRTAGLQNPVDDLRALGSDAACALPRPLGAP